MRRGEEKELFAQLDDDELIARTAAGDRDSFDILVRRYQKKVYFLALRMMRNHDDADDMAQETFIRAYRAIGSFKPGCRFFTWLYRICMNLCINELKRGKHLLTESRFEEEEKVLERESETENPLDFSSGRELRRRIDGAIESLSPKYKSVFVLRVLEEMSYEEIAESLDISTGTVMSRLFRARETIQNLLREYKERRS